MHNGEFQTLRAVIEFYDQGGVAHEGLSPLMTPLGLSEIEKVSLEAFLLSLTSDNVAMLVLDGFAQSQSSD